METDIHRTVPVEVRKKNIRKKSYTIVKVFHIIYILYTFEDTCKLIDHLTECDIATIKLF